VAEVLAFPALSQQAVPAVEAVPILPAGKQAILAPENILVAETARIADPLPIPVLKEVIVSDVVLVESPPAASTRSGIPMKPLLPLGVLLLGLLVPMIRDTWVWLRGDHREGETKAAVDNVPRLELGFHDRDLNWRYGAGLNIKDGPAEVGAKVWFKASNRFGLTLAGEEEQRKRLTREPEGLTNNTVVLVDSRHQWIFGESPWQDQDTKKDVFLEGNPRTGHWSKPLSDLPSTGNQKRLGKTCTWRFDALPLEMTQVVEIVRGPQTDLLDTCLITYQASNYDSRSHRVGIRMLLDTFIGSNDGVPFLIPSPGEKEQLCKTFLTLPAPGRGIPEFIQALEEEDLTNPRTVALLQLKLHGLDAPTRVTLGAWPNRDLNRFGEFIFRQEKTLWNVPVRPIHSLAEPDSAVVLYWDERLLQPGETRRVGFTYGLGSVASAAGGGRLALTTSSEVTRGSEFTVTAYLKNPLPGQQITLSLPEGFQLVKGASTQAVPPASTSTSAVSWAVRAGPKEGSFDLSVSSSSGERQHKTISVQPRGIFGNN
jgi:hypothetical protein